MASDVKKMKQGMSYSCKEKTIILNVFKYFKILFPDKCVTELVRQTSRATGCSEKSIFRFRKEESSAEGFRAPSKTKIRKNININSRDMKYNDSVRQSIRNIVHDLKQKKVVPSLNTILRQIHEDNQLPNFSLMTLRRLLFDMGFIYEKVGNKSILIEKPLETQDSGKTKKVFPNSMQQVPVKVNKVPEIPQTERTHSFADLPNGGRSNNFDNLPKPIPQHPVMHNSNGNVHKAPMDQSMGFRHHHSLMPMQGLTDNHNHSFMDNPMHSQFPIPHHMPMMLSHHQRPNPMVPTQFNMGMPKEALMGL